MSYIAYCSRCRVESSSDHIRLLNSIQTDIHELDTLAVHAHIVSHFSLFFSDENINYIFVMSMCWLQRIPPNRIRPQRQNGYVLSRHLHLDIERDSIVYSIFCWTENRNIFGEKRNCGKKYNSEALTWKLCVKMRWILVCAVLCCPLVKFSSSFSRFHLWFVLVPCNILTFYCLIFS